MFAVVAVLFIQPTRKYHCDTRFHWARMGIYFARLLAPGLWVSNRVKGRTVMVERTISPYFFEGMHMNKVLVAGILGLMLTACGQKEEAAAPAATPAADVAATVEKAASEATSTVEKAASEATATVEKAASKAEAAVSDAKAN